MIIIGASNIKEHDGNLTLRWHACPGQCRSARWSKLSEVLRFDPFLWLGKKQMV